MKNTQWDTSRTAYTAYKAAKRKLNQICKDHTRTYYQLERAFKQYSAAKFEAENNLRDLTQPDKLIAAFKVFQEAKLNHDATRVAFSEGLKAFQAVEREYSIIIFKGLREKHNLKVADLARVFGVYNSQIANWLRADNEAKIAEMYNEEFNVSELEEDDI